MRYANYNPVLDVVVADNSAEAVTVTLPDSTLRGGKKCVVKAGTGNFPVVVKAVDGQLIGGFGTVRLSYANSSTEFTPVIAPGVGYILSQQSADSQRIMGSAVRRAVGAYTNVPLAAGQTWESEKVDVSEAVTVPYTLLADQTAEVSYVYWESMTDTTPMLVLTGAYTEVGQLKRGASLPIPQVMSLRVKNTSASPMTKLHAALWLSPNLLEPGYGQANAGVSAMNRSEVVRAVMVGRDGAGSNAGFPFVQIDPADNGVKVHVANPVTPPSTVAVSNLPGV